MSKSILKIINKSANSKKKLLGVLIDPEKFNAKVVKNAIKAKIDFILVGGSKVIKSDFKRAVNSIKKHCKIPLIIFPGDENQISHKADALFLLSLVSGRNSEYLIGKHVRAAEALKKSKLEIIPTGYIMLNGGKNSSTSIISKTKPISKKNIISITSTSIASELLGMKLIYLEAGSGAKNIISGRIIKMVKKNVNIPVICGGGIDSKKKVEQCWKNGADLVIIGNALEKDPDLILKINKKHKN